MSFVVLVLASVGSGLVVAGRRRRECTTLVLVPVALVGLPLAKPAALHCPAALVAAGAQSQASADRATLCLINLQRRSHHLRPLHASRQLGVAARRHARSMARLGYVSHVSPGGATLADRLRRSHYLSRRCGWHIGEALGWGTGVDTTPVARVDGWMQSPLHRALLLDRDFRDIGIGVGHGSRVATFVADFGHRVC